MGRVHDARVSVRRHSYLTFSLSLSLPPPPPPPPPLSRASTIEHRHISLLSTYLTLRIEGSAGNVNQHEARSKDASSMTVFQLLGRICGRQSMGLPARSCTARLFCRSNAA